MLEDLILQALALSVLLQVKHLFADYFLQTPMMLRDRGKYLHIGRVAHVLVHAAGSLVAFAVVGAPLPVMIGIVLIEAVLHFHIDYGKGRWSDFAQDGPSDASYWRAHGVDQAAHQLTYVGMAVGWALAVM